MDDHDSPRRRTVLRTSATLLLTAGLAGCGEHEGYGEFTEPTGTDTSTPGDAIEADQTIAVGPDGDYTFEPGTAEAATVLVGDTVAFEWRSDGHSIAVDEAPDGTAWEGHPSAADEGFVHSHTFETAGTYSFHCDAHPSLGATATLEVQEPPNCSEPAESVADPEPTQTVTVGPNGDLVYDPGTEEPLYVTPGTTVRFVWESDNHNVNPRHVPRDAGWEGHRPTENTGFEYEHTFETLGTYEFQCDPHAGLGMDGTIVVNASGEPPAGGPNEVDDTVCLGSEAPPEIQVGPGGEYVFAPGTEATAVVDSGTDVTFRWASDNHNVVVTASPADADWTGHESTEDAGFEYEHTFTVPGRYEFECEPHVGLGMTGTLVVESTE
ncbi:plastocyanin/azurin family copper-binding protein [Haloarchaeobius baliensis]|uniref:plastocyanin/azurin family copper-binding protein n=1 Tax=Haloarchaeobius baliensis TaxID=1670458 RepID=UPI003F884393